MLAGKTPFPKFLEPPFWRSILRKGSKTGEGSREKTGVFSRASVLVGKFVDAVSFVRLCGFHWDLGFN